MIDAETRPDPGFAERLAERARRSTEARATSRLLARRNDPRRWRIASLLWPNSRQET